MNDDAVCVRKWVFAMLLGGNLTHISQKAARDLAFNAKAKFVFLLQSWILFAILGANVKREIAGTRDLSVN